MICSQVYLIPAVFPMTTHLRDILIHILSDDPRIPIPDSMELPDQEVRDLLSSVVERKSVLQQKKNRMDAVFAHSPQPILILSPDTHITEVNQSFIQMSGLAPEVCVGTPVSTIVPGFILSDEGTSHISTESEIFPIDFPSGRRVLELYPIPVRDASGTLTEIILVFKDITIRVQAEQQAEEIQQKLAHDYGERVKEQKLFYSVASLIQDDSLSVPDVLSKVALLIPPGWQYPEETTAQIFYGNESFKTPDYDKTPWTQQALFRTRSGTDGIIEVAYLSEKPPEYEGPFLLEERNLINSLAEMLKTYIDRKEGEQELAKKMHDLGERVKEQQLFYKTSSLIQDDSKRIADVLQNVVMLIPPGWQFPEVTGARIHYGELDFQTENFHETPWIQRSSFVTRTGKLGNVEVVYLQEKPAEHEGPFLKEERNLINSLADMLKTYIDRKEGEQELERRMDEIEELEHLNNTIVQQIPMPVLLIDENQQILVTNDAYIRLTGYTRDELFRMTPRDITVLEYTGEGLKELLSTMKPTFGELTCEFPVGIRILEQYGIPIYSKSGSLENLLIVYNDITGRKRQEEEVQKLLDDSRTMSETLSMSAGDLKTGMARMAEGDLRYRAPVTEHDPLSQIKNDYNTALSAISLLIEELEGSISHLTGTSEQTLSQTDNIKQAIRDIADEVQNSTVGARDQMEETRRISDDIRLLSDRISQIVDITTRLMELAAQTARQGAEAGQIGGVANEKMESVGRISADNMKQITGLNEQMAEIDKIVRLISDISSQTNLLALNAAIEAARAGEHGRGFAVVAQEVKNLAGQSKLATYQIEELIRSIQTKSADTVTSIEAAYTEIQEGIASVNKTIDALSSITSHVAEISDGISQVTRATMDEETLMQRVQEGIGIMNSESEKNLARMEEISHRMDESRHATDDIASSSLEIARLSGNLKKQSDRFSL